MLQTYTRLCSSPDHFDFSIFYTDQHGTKHTRAKRKEKSAKSPLVVGVGNVGEHEKLFYISFNIFEVIVSGIR